MCTDDDFSNTTCIDHFTVEELAAYHAWESRLRTRRRRTEEAPRGGPTDGPTLPEKDPCENS